MSYILEALRKSEAERRQGKAPDLGQSVQMIHRPRRKPVSLLVWIVLGLFLNAGILGYVFWPEIQAAFAPAATEPPAEDVVSEPPPPVSVAPVQAQPEVPEHGEPTIIVPRPMAQQQELTATRSQGRVPHLVELPLSFQKSIPDLTFNSHIVSSNSSASSVMINSQYLRAGDSMGPLLIEQINEDGVVFRKDGQQFRVGTMRNWVSPR
ncbi:MAG: general secretion pathway protein GspB [Pseudomonadota bacterium]